MAESHSMDPNLLRFLAELGHRKAPAPAPKPTPSSLAKTVRLPRIG